MRSILKASCLILLANLFVSFAGIAPLSAASIIYSTYLGGTVVDRVNAIALDSSDNVYLVGKTVSTGFPGAGSGFQTTIATGTDAFVTRITSGGVLSWSTYLGGDGIDIANAVAVDNAGVVYIAGSTTSTTFPMKNADIGIYVGGTDTFVTAVSASGAGLHYSTYLGGSGVDEGFGIAVNATTGAAYVVGVTTASAPTAFVTTANPDGYGSGLLARGAEDVFVVEFDPAGGLAHACLLGGTTADIGRAIAIDGTGKIYITGQTTDTFTTTPSCFKGGVTGATDAFVAILSADFATLLYGTYIGGNNNEDAFGIALDSTLNVYIAGYSNSTANFPITGFGNMVGQTIKGTGEDAFVFKLNAGSAGISDGVYATFIGGDGIDRATAIKVDSLGNAYVIGYTESTASTFPLSSPIVSPDLSIFNGSKMAFVAVIGPSPVAAELPVFCSYLGGSDATFTEGWGIGLDTSNNIYAVGYTASALFPIVSELYTYQGSEDGFLTKISAVSAGTVATPVITPADGLYTGSVIVTMTTGTSLATIRYTTNGAGLTDYSGPVTKTSTSTIVAYAVKGGMLDSATATGTFTLKAITPVVTPAAGLYTGSVILTMTTGTAGATIRYTTNGAGLLDYTVPVTKSSTSTIVAYAVKGGMLDSASTASSAFTILSSITSIAPAGGIIAGGTTVTVTGSGFTGTTLVTEIMFGAMKATSFIVDSNTQIRAIAPVHLAGVVDVVSMSSVGTSAIVAADEYTYFLSGSVPTIAGLNPVYGPASGGATVVITGTGFTGVVGASGVKFGNLNADSYVVNSDTKITAKTKAHDVGPVDVIVMNPSGFSLTVSAGTYTYMLSAPVSGGSSYIYPSPSTGGTVNINYFMDGPGIVKIRVYSITGKLVDNLEESKLDGAQRSSLTVGNLAPGVYFYMMNMNYDNGDIRKFAKHKFVVVR